MTESNWHKTCKACIGRTQTSTDELPPHTSNSLLATLDDDPTLVTGAPVPQLFHWLYFNETIPTSQLRSDGHEKPGSFLPPVRYPHRMWAGSNIQFHHPLLLGEVAERTSAIKSVDFKSGSSGALCFVNVEHHYHQRGRLCLTDIHTIVYRKHTANTILRTIAGEAPVLQKSNTRSVDAIVLFRYSALTFNSHRIHYDYNYCKNVEGYPGLVVHGPLMATLLIRHVQEVRPKQAISSFSFRGHQPVFDGEEFELVTDASSQNTTSSLIKCDGTEAMTSKVAWVAPV